MDKKRVNEFGYAYDDGSGDAPPQAGSSAPAVMGAAPGKPKTE